MSIHIKTNKPNTLCSSCRNGTIMRTEEGDVSILCSAFEKRINAIVVECGSHFPKDYLYEHELMRMAWLIDPREKRKDRIGFVAPGTPDHVKIRNGTYD